MCEGEIGMGKYGCGGRLQVASPKELDKTRRSGWKYQAVALNSGIACSLNCIAHREAFMALESIPHSDEMLVIALNSPSSWSRSDLPLALDHVTTDRKPRPRPS